jgi:murein DD-endopeptidase MepM/ murein hydrolase activator NlpD
MAKKTKTVISRLRNKYRLVVLNDETFEEKVSLKLSRLNVFLVLTIASILLVGSTILLVAFTPLREYIPGYASTELRRATLDLTLKTDSLETQLAYSTQYLANIKNIINGNPVDPTSEHVSDSAGTTGTLDPGISAADSTLRKTVEEEERFNISNTPDQNLAGFSFMAPVKGLLTSTFDKALPHYGVDVTSKKNTPIKSCLAGTVIFAEWTTETGYVMIVQHGRELISVYKHCSALLKKPGNYVQTGQAIAIIGNSGETSTGPHLHFELWHQGNPVNPQNYISF